MRQILLQSEKMQKSYAALREKIEEQRLYEKL